MDVKDDGAHRTPDEWAELYDPLTPLELFVQIAEMGFDIDGYYAIDVLSPIRSTDESGPLVWITISSIVIHRYTHPWNEPTPAAWYVYAVRKAVNPNLDNRKVES